MFGCWEVEAYWKDVLKCAPVMDGELCVIMAGALLMVEWCAENLDTAQRVSCTN